MQVTQFQDFIEDGRTSMEVYADALIHALQTHFSDQCQIYPYRPKYPKYLSTNIWGLRLARFVFYQEQARSHQRQVNHVLDHGYGHLLYALEPMRTIVTVHDLIPILRWKGRIAGVVPERKPWLNIISFHALQRAAHLIAISESTRNDLVELCGCAPEKITVIYYGVDPGFRVYSPLEKIKTLKKWNLPANNSRRILIIGSNFYKNQIGALSAFARLRELYNKPVELLKVGAPDLEWMQGVENLGLGDVAKCLGPVRHSEMSDIYNSVDCLLFPSLYEGFGWPPLEAMACGLPVVASNAASLPEVIGNAGIICNPLDIEAVAQAMLQFFTDDSLRGEYIQRGFSQAKRFTWQETARKTLEVYETIARE